jgi:hypothetical protein
VKVYVPTDVGVPEILPFDASVRPGGRLPESVVQVYGAVPPVACSEFV